MAKSIIINAKANVLRAAVISNKILDNLFIDRNKSSSIVGNIYQGRVDSLMPSIQAAFVDIGIGKNGFLQLKNADFAKKYEQFLDKNKQHAQKPVGQELKQGKFILVQVVKEEIGTKGVRLDTNISLPGRFLVVMPVMGHGKVYISRKIENKEHREYLKDKVIPKLNIPDGMDIIIRTAAAGVKSKFLIDDFDSLVQIWNNIKKEEETKQGVRCLHEELDLVRKIVRDWLDDSVENIFVDDQAIFEVIRNFLKRKFAKPKVKLRYYKSDINIFDKFGISGQIEKLYTKKVWLKCGGYIVIDKAEALVAIDVNTGKNVKHTNSEETILETNLQAAEMIARQLRLRNMGGIVIIDFIDMKSPKDRRAVLKCLYDNLEKDKAKSKIYPFTRLGLIQLTRQRVEESWEQHYFIDCDRCSGTGRILSIPVICDQITSKINRFLSTHVRVDLNIRANEEVVDFLLKNNSFEKIEKQFKIEIGYLKDENYHPDKYLVIRKDLGTNILSQSA